MNKYNKDDIIEDTLYEKKAIISGFPSSIGALEMAILDHKMDNIELYKKKITD